MNTFAAVMTGQGVGAISTIYVFGENAETIVKKIFKPVSEKRKLSESEICLGIFPPFYLRGCTSLIIFNRWLN